MTSRENSSDEISIVQASHTDGKKQVLNSSANPSARQNTKNNKKSIKEDNANKKLTDFFPIRRSVRKTNKEVQQELLRSYEKAIIEQSEDGLEVVLKRSKSEVSCYNSYSIYRLNILKIKEEGWLLLDHFTKTNLYWNILVN